MEARRYVLLSLALMAVIAAWLLGGEPRDAAAYQHVVNGSFEEGTNAWQQVAGALEAVSSESAEPTEGTHVGVATVGGNGFTVQQRLNDVLNPGHYTLSIDVRAKSVGLPVTIFLTAADERIELDGIAQSSGWTTIEGAVTISLAAPAAMWIDARGADGDVLYLDNVRLDGAPPVIWTPTPTFTATSTTSPTIAAGITETTPTPGASATPVLDAIARSLRNGGFEDGDGVPFAWERYGGSLSSATSPVRSGGRAARLESSTTSTKWLHQVVSVDGTSAYSFDAWIMHDDPNVAAAFLRVSWYASDDGSGEAIGTADSTARLDTHGSDYRHLTTSAIAAPQDARTARLRVMLAPRSDARAVIYVDDASWSTAQFVASPVPMATPVPHVDTVAGSANAVAGATITRTRGTSAVLPAARLGSRIDGAARVVINEVLYDAAGEGPDTGNEWVELYNAGPAPAVLSGWALADATSADALPDMVIEPGAFAVVAASESFRATYAQFDGALVVLDGRIGNSLNNDGDALALLDGQGATADEVSWGDNESALKPAVADVPAGHSIERRIAGADTNAAADFVDNESPSPGAAIGTSNGKPQRQTSSGSQVEVIDGGDASPFGWLPWALAASSVSALAVLGGWRLVSMLRERAVARG